MKFSDPRVVGARERLWPGASWTFALVVGIVKLPEELEEIRERGIGVLELATVLDDLAQDGDGDWPIKKTSSTAADVAALIGMDRKLRPGGHEAERPGKPCAGCA